MANFREKINNGLQLTFFTDSEISEESHFLHARLTELERMKKKTHSGMTNSSVSSEDSLNEFDQLRDWSEKSSKIKENGQQQQQNNLQMNNNNNLEKNSIGTLKEQLDKNAITISQLENELRELKKKQMDNSDEQQKADKTELLAKFNEEREANGNAQQKTEKHLNKLNERLKALAIYYRHSKTVLEENQKKIAAMEFMFGMFIFLLIISPLVYYFHFYF